MPCGAVLGIDVGYSERKRSTGFCVLSWDAEKILVRLQRTTSDAQRRRAALADLLPYELPLLAVAIDGPLAHGFELIRHYRTADALFAHGVFQKRGKAGQTSSPVGQRLHQHATLLAHMVMEAAAQVRCRMAAAAHRDPIHELAIVEAFPNQFLAALLPEGDLPALRRDASDRYWEACTALTLMSALLSYVLPDRALTESLNAYSNHDDRAAIVCALTALCVCAGEAAGAGDPIGGDIMLPPPPVWGRSLTSTQPWMEIALVASLAAVRRRHPQGRSVRLTYRGQQWLP